MGSEAVREGLAGREIAKRKAHLVVFPVLSLLLTVPLAVYGYPWVKYDFLFHFTSWAGYADTLSNGVVLPAWYDQANYGLGEPRYLFYPPLSIILGGLLSLLLPARMVAGAFIFLSTMLVCYTTWWLGRALLGYRDRIMVAVLAAISFGIINSGLMRFAMAELLASALLPLALLFFYRMKSGHNPSGFLRFSLVTAIIWLTNIPLAVANAYVLGMVACWSGIMERKPALLGKYIGAQLLAILLVAFYLVPAFFSQQYISVDQLGFSSDSLVEHMLERSKALLIGVISLMAMLIFVMTWTLKRPVVSEQGEIILMVGVVGFLLQLPGIVTVFNLLPLAHTVGYSFRFYSYVSIAFPFVVFCFYRAAMLRWGVALLYSGFLIACIVAQYGHSKGSAPQRPDYYQPTQTVLASHEAGFTGYPEYVPSGTGATMIEHVDNAVKQRVTVAGSDCATRVEQWEAQDKQVQVVASHSPCRITLGTYDFPWWETRIDGHPARHQTADDGRIVIEVPAGAHEVSLRFERPLLLTLSGAAITALGLAGVGYLWRRSRKGHRHRWCRNAA